MLDGGTPSPLALACLPRLGRSIVLGFFVINVSAGLQGIPPGEKRDVIRAGTEHV